MVVIVDDNRVTGSCSTSHIVLRCFAFPSFSRLQLPTQPCTPNPRADSKKSPLSPNPAFQVREQSHQGSTSLVASRETFFFPSLIPAFGSGAILPRSLPTPCLLFLLRPCRSDKYVLRGRTRRTHPPHTSLSLSGAANASMDVLPRNLFLGTRRSGTVPSSTYPQL